MKKFTFVCILLCMLTVAAFAQEVFVNYLEGSVTATIDGRRTNIDFGSLIGMDTMLELGESSLIELEFRGSRILINRPGSYSLADLFAASANSTPQGVMGSLSRRIQNLSQPNIEQQGSQAGVRGSEAAAQQNQWALGGARDLFHEGFILIADGNIQEAYDVFDEAYYYASDDEFPEASFYLGYAAMLMGDYSEAREMYDSVEFSPEDGELYSLYLISDADLYLKEQSYTAAIDRLSPILNSNLTVSPESLQRARYMAALAYRGLGNHMAERRELEEVALMTADPQLQAIARRILSSP